MGRLLGLLIVRDVKGEDLVLVVAVLPLAGGDSDHWPAEGPLERAAAGSPSAWNLDAAAPTDAVLVRCVVVMCHGEVAAVVGRWCSGVIWGLVALLNTVATSLWGAEAVL